MTVAWFGFCAGIRYGTTPGGAECRYKGIVGMHSPVLVGMKAVRLGTGTGIGRAPGVCTPGACPNAVTGVGRGWYTGACDTHARALRTCNNNNTDILSMITSLGHLS